MRRRVHWLLTNMRIVSGDEKRENEEKKFGLSKNQARKESRGKTGSRATSSRGMTRPRELQIFGKGSWLVTASDEAT